MTNTLELVLLLLAASVFMVALFRGFNLPPVLGYLMVGAAIGPHALNLMSEGEGAGHLAEDEAGSHRGFSRSWSVAVARSRSVGPDHSRSSAVRFERFITTNPAAPTTTTPPAISAISNPVDIPPSSPPPSMTVRLA